MSTSLSRQLEQLRTVSQSQLTSTYSVASQAPNVLEKHVGAEQLTLLAKEALEVLTQLCPIVGNFRKTLFKDDVYDPLPNSEEDDTGIDLGTDLGTDLEDLLFLLSPTLLKPAAQYLLQYLVVRHSVHVKYPETVLFCALPYLSHTIFHRIVGALPTRFGKVRAEEDHPRWVENFNFPFFSSFSPNTYACTMKLRKKFPLLHTDVLTVSPLAWVS